MKKGIIISLICILIIGLSVWGYIELRKNSVSAKKDLYESVPGEPCAVLQINNLRSLQESLLYNNNYWLNLTAIKTLNKTHILLAALDSLKESDPAVARLIDRSALLSIYESSNRDSHFLITSQMSISDYEKAAEIAGKYLKTNAKTEYYNEFLLASESDSLITLAKQCIDAGTSPILQDQDFHKARLSAGNKQKANIFLNAARCQDIIRKYVLESRERLFTVSRQYDNWCGYDVDFSVDKIEINGFAFCKNGGDLVAAFQNQNTERNTLSAAMPYNTFFFRHFAISNLEDYKQLLFPDDYSFDDTYAENFENLSNDTDSLETTSGENPETFMQEFFGGEIAFGYSPLNEFVIVKLINGSEASAALQRIATELNPNCASKYQGIEMYHIGTNGFAGSIFGPYFTLEDEYICVDGDNLIITPTEQFTAYIATRNPKTQTLQCSPVFRSADRTLLSTSNRSIYIDIPYIVRNASKFFTPELSEKITTDKEIWNAFDCIGLQSENEGKNMDYQHIFIQYSGQRGTFAELPDDTPEQTEELLAAAETVETETKQAATISGSVQKLFTIALDAPACIKPQIFTNHYTGENEIFIQDTKNQIYLISASGKILWKTSVKEAVIGGVETVDILNNKKLQIAFVTKSKLYVIDRNGKMVSGYPLALTGGVCTPLAVFDYEGKKDYRFAYGTEDNKAHIIKKDGSVLPEWRNVRTKSHIDGKMRHFRLSGKDFIVYADADKCYFLDRKANVRLKCGGTLIKSSGNEIYTDVAGNRIALTLSNGKICFVTTADKATSTQLKQYGGNHSFVQSGGYYFFGYDKGFDIYDADLNPLYSDNTDVSAIDACGNTCGAYSKSDGKLYIYRHSGSDFAKASVKTTSNLFTLSTLKPLSSTVAIICSGTSLEVYGLD